jgi:hypothetical protein
MTYQPRMRDSYTEEGNNLSTPHTYNPYHNGTTTTSTYQSNVHGLNTAYTTNQQPIRTVTNIIDGTPSYTNSQVFQQSQYRTAQ